MSGPDEKTDQANDRIGSPHGSLLRRAGGHRDAERLCGKRQRPAVIDTNCVADRNADAERGGDGDVHSDARIGCY